MAAPQRRGRSSSNSNTSQAAESSGSDTSSYEDQILALMRAPFNLPREDAEAKSLLIQQPADPPTAVDAPKEIIDFYSNHREISMTKASLTLDSTIFQVPLIPALVYARPMERSGDREVYKLVARMRM